MSRPMSPTRYMCMASTSTSMSSLASDRVEFIRRQHRYLRGRAGGGSLCISSTSRSLLDPNADCRPRNRRPARSPSPVTYFVAGAAVVLVRFLRRSGSSLENAPAASRILPTKPRGRPPVSLGWLGWFGVLGSGPRDHRRAGRDRHEAGANGNSQHRPRPSLGLFLARCSLSLADRLGNLYTGVNPVADAGVVARDRGGRTRPARRSAFGQPRLGLLAFAWLELVYPGDRRPSSHCNRRPSSTRLSSSDS